MKHEYHEGPKAKENFEKLAGALFRAAKPEAKTPPKKAVGTRRKANNPLKPSK